jgi:3-O-alpha-D-mannopyranosyl-alpha-D-mannopyranose xylosylphosphotransferase
MGIRDGMWDDETRTAIRDLFGMTEDDGDVAQIEVHRGERWTTKKDRLKEVFAQAGWDAPKVTNYLFSSMDGHIPQLLEPGKGGSNDVCILDLDECFGSFWSESQSVSATEAFRRLTFEKPECGDCSKFC